MNHFIQVFFSPEQIEAIALIIRNGIVKDIWPYLLLSLGIGIVLTIGLAFLTSFGQKWAEKNMLGSMTDIIATINSKFHNAQEIEKLKRELKYSSILKSLEIIDAAISHFPFNEPNINIVKQAATTAEARACHNNLILSCNNIKIIEIFIVIMDGFRSSNEFRDRPLVILNEYRNLVRSELGFGPLNTLNPEKAWLVKADFDNPF